MLGEHVHFNVYFVARATHAERRYGRSVWNDCNLKRVTLQAEGGETHTVDGHRAFFDDEMHLVAPDAHPQVGGWRHDFTDEVNMAEHHVATETPVSSHWSLKIHWAARLQCAERGAQKSFVAHIGFPPVFTLLHNRQTAAVHCNGGANDAVAQHVLGGDSQA